MKKTVPITVKRECETQWSSRVEAVKAIYDGLDALMELLERLSEDQTVTAETDALNLLQSILNFNFLVLLHGWNTILRKINRVQKRLQEPKINFHESSSDLEALQHDFIKIRDPLCQSVVELAKAKCQLWGVAVERKVRRRRQMPGELAQDTGLSAEQEIVRVVKSAFD